MTAIGTTQAIAIAREAYTRASEQLALAADGTVNVGRSFFGNPRTRPFTVDERIEHATSGLRELKFGNELLEKTGIRHHYLDSRALPNRENWDAYGNVTSRTAVKIVRSGVHLLHGGSPGDAQPLFRSTGYVAAEQAHALATMQIDYATDAQMAKRLEVVRRVLAEHEPTPALTAARRASEDMAIDDAIRQAVAVAELT